MLSNQAIGLDPTYLLVHITNSHNWSKNSPEILIKLLKFEISLANLTTDNVRLIGDLYNAYVSSIFIVATVQNELFYPNIAPHRLKL
jgi:hypothetical protein